MASAATDELRVTWISSGNQLVPDQLEVSLPLAGDPVLRLWPESWFARVAKGLDFSIEHQTGDVVFDKRVYVGIDDRHAAAALCARKEGREAVLSLFDLGAREITAHGGRLRARFGKQPGFDSSTGLATTDAAHQWLAAVQAHLRELLPDAAIIKVARKSSRLGLVLAGIGIAAVLALIVEKLARDVVIAPDRVMGLYWPAAISGVGAALLAAIAAAYHFEGRATAHVSMGVLLLIGLPSGAAIGFAGGVGLNRWLDPHPAQEVVAPILNAWTESGRRSLPTSFLTVEHPPGSGAMIKLQVGLIERNAAEQGTGQCAAFKIGEGRFGYTHAFGTRVISCPANY